MTNNFELFRVPEKIYFKKGCLPVALRELKEVYSIKRVLILADNFRNEENEIQQITDRLHEMQIDYAVSEPDSEINSAPECILAYGHILETDAKIAAALPEKPYYVTIPSHFGTYEHVMPLPDGRFPDMTIIDTDIMQTDANVIKMALTAALSALASEKATEYSDSMAVRAVQSLLNYQNCSQEQLADAGTLAGCAFVNAHAEKNQWLSHKAVCAEKLGMETEQLLKSLEAIAFNF